MFNSLRIYAVTCIGNNGEIGLNGRLPWINNDDLREATRRDLQMFRLATSNCLLIAGRITHDTLEPIISRHPYGRVITNLKTPEDLEIFFLVLRQADPDQFERLTKNPIWIIGGMQAYAGWARYTKKVFVSTMNYEDKADTYFPFKAFPHLKSEDYCSLNHFTARKLYIDTLAKEWEIH